MTNILHCFWIESKYLSIILLTILSFSTLPGHSQKFENCGESCFKSEIVSLEESEAGCLDYEIKVTYKGKCTAALSHYTLDMGCGSFANASNSAGWPIILNETDPTSGLSGLKVDNIAEFGDESSLESFTLNFTFCPTNCEEGKSCFNPQVAYKAATCIYTETVDAQCIKPLNVQTHSVGLNCVDNFDGAITLDISGGKEPYQIEWDHGAKNTELIELASGIYGYTVISADGQIVTGQAEITSPDAIVLDNTITQPICDGSTLGAISLTTSGGIAPYSYQWSDGSTETSRSNLSDGMYTVTVTDQSGCSINQSFEITTPNSVAITAEVVQPDCGNLLGSITLTNNEEGYYTYLWADGSTEQIRSELAAGTYSVVIGNEQGCQVEKSFEIEAADGSLSVSGNLAQPSCQQTNGEIEVVVSGGVSPYTYQWAHGEEGTTLDGLAAGSYSVTVTDANGCSASTTFSLVSQNTIFLMSQETNTNCQNDPIGAIDLRVIGGTAPFTYEWSTGETTEDITGLTEGTYSVQVTDAAGCSRTLTKRIRQNTFYLSGSTQNKICDTPGSIDLTLYYAEAPISYTWSNGSTTEDIDNLSPGQYSVTVVDGRGCKVSRSFSIYESNNLSLTFNPTVQGCGEQTTYSLEGTAVGGTAPFTYLWSDGTTSSSIENIVPGTYELTVSDANGCSRTASYTVETQTNATDCLIQASATSVSCNTSNNILSTNIADAQSYQWSVGSSDGLWVIDSGADSKEINFSAGSENSSATFTLQLTTVEGCVAECLYTVSSCVASDPNDPANDPNDGTDDTGDGTDDTGDDGTGDGSSDEGGDSSSGDGTDDGTNGGDDSDDGTTDDSDDNSGNDESTDDESDDDGSGENDDDNDNSDSSDGDGSSGSDENPDEEGENDAEDEPGKNGNDQTCTDCFDAQVVEVTNEDRAYHYTITVSSDLTCNFDLSNMVINLPECAILDSYSNSKGWKMEKVYADKNTGLTGIKVEGIPSFGKDASFTEFTIHLSLSTYDSDCQELLGCWSPQVAFKAGQCVIKENASPQCVPEELDLTAYPNPAAESVRIDVASLNANEVYSVSVFDTQGTPLKEIDQLTVADLAELVVSLDGIRSTFVYLKVTGSGGSTWTSKVMRSQ